MSTASHDLRKLWRPTWSRATHFSKLLGSALARMATRKTSISEAEVEEVSLLSGANLHLTRHWASTSYTHMTLSQKSLSSMPVGLTLIPLFLSRGVTAPTGVWLLSRTVFVLCHTTERCSHQPPIMLGLGASDFCSVRPARSDTGVMDVTVM